MILFIYLITIIAGGISQIIWFLDAPSLVAVLGMQFIILGASGHFHNFFRGFRLVFSSSKYAPEELSALAEKSEYAVGFGIRITMLSGLLGSIIGGVVSMGHLDTPETKAPETPELCLSNFVVIEL